MTAAYVRTVYKIGDTEAGGPGRVVVITKGEAANQLGYDVAVIVDAGTNTSVSA